MKIQILMSTYNGSEYIRNQLDSIAAQDIEEKYLLIRDDGSVDSTLDIIREYQEKHPWISYYKGENLGVQKSFLELMSRAEEDADYIAFADQDDMWTPDKISRAVCCLEDWAGKPTFSPAAPLLYCSDKQIVGRNLEPLKVTVSREVRKVSFGNALVQNICTGCTAVANRALIHLIREHMPKEPEKIIMHDWWLYLTASCFGGVFYDREAHIRYRQHGENTSGAMLNRRQLLAHRVKQLMGPRGGIYRQAEEFMECYQPVLKKEGYEQQRELIFALLLTQRDFRKRLRVIADRRYFRQKRMDDLVFRGILLLGKL